jgi:hypothetical protein
VNVSKRNSAVHLLLIQTKINLGERIGCRIEKKRSWISRYRKETFIHKPYILLKIEGLYSWG